VIHLKPLVGGELMPSFLAANPFVARYYPNARAPLDGEPALLGPGRLRIKALLEAAATPFAPLWEGVCRRAYRAYLTRRAGSWRSPDQVRLGLDALKLHTQSHRASILSRFDEAMTRAVSRVDDEMVPLRTA
jgi:hypothetical protein